MSALLIASAGPFGQVVRRQHLKRAREVTADSQTSWFKFRPADEDRLFLHRPRVSQRLLRAGGEVYVVGTAAVPLLDSSGFPSLSYRAPSLCCPSQARC